jgi:hypothetical protein
VYLPAGCLPGAFITAIWQWKMINRDTAKRRLAVRSFWSLPSTKGKAEMDAELGVCSTP